MTRIRKAVLLSAGLIVLTAHWGLSRAEAVPSCNSQVWAMFVAGSLQGFSECQYDWTLQKTVTPTSVTIPTGTSQSVSQNAATANARSSTGRA